MVNYKYGSAVNLIKSKLLLYLKFWTNADILYMHEVNPLIPMFKQLAS
jgi:hypothetical protein